MDDQKASELQNQLAEYHEAKLTKDVISDPSIAADLVRYKTIGKNEKVVAIFLNVKNKVIKTSVISEGSIDYCVISPRKIVEQAIECGAKGLILGHNHPSGDTQRSRQDESITKKIFMACKFCEIDLLDHLIVTYREVLSFADIGVIEDLNSEYKRITA